MDDLRRATERLRQGDVTCALCGRGRLVTATRRGVAPLLDWLDSGKDYIGFCAADKVVGKAAALLYVRLGVVAVYAPVMSRPAAAVLAAHGIAATADVFPAAIRNRAGDGFCPMETAVWDIDDPASAEQAIRATLARLATQI